MPALLLPAVDRELSRGARPASPPGCKMQGLGPQASTALFFSYKNARIVPDSLRPYPTFTPNPPQFLRSFQQL
jgi:hypothetical protein